MPEQQTTDLKAQVIHGLNSLADLSAIEEIFMSVGQIEREIEDLLYENRLEQQGDSKSSTNNPNSKSPTNSTAKNSRNNNDNTANTKGTSNRTRSRDSTGFIDGKRTNYQGWKTRMDEKIKDVAIEKNRLKTVVLEKSATVNSLRVQYSELQAEIKRKEGEIAEKRESAGKQRALRKRQYDMYREVTGIHWDSSDVNGSFGHNNNGYNNSLAVKGYVSLEHLSAFDFTHLANADGGRVLADALWDKIESCA